jgi:hypothetical protein
VATVEDSVLRTEMPGLESQKQDDHKSILFFNPMSWLGQIRPHRRVWSASLWQTFFTMTKGAQIPVIAENPLAICGCRKFQRCYWWSSLYLYDLFGCQSAHDWAVDQLTLCVQHKKSRRNRWLEAVVSIVGTYSSLPTLRMRRVLYLWCWISTSPTTVSDVALTLLLMETYITLLI